MNSFRETNMQKGHSAEQPNSGGQRDCPEPVHPRMLQICCGNLSGDRVKAGVLAPRCRKESETFFGSLMASEGAATQGWGGMSKVVNGKVSERPGFQGSCQLLRSGRRWQVVTTASADAFGEGLSVLPSPS